MLAGMLLGLAASACWALANVAVQRAGRAVGPYRALALGAGGRRVVAVAAVAIPFDRQVPRPLHARRRAVWIAGAGLRRCSPTSACSTPSRTAGSRWRCRSCRRGRCSRRGCRCCCSTSGCRGGQLGGAAAVVAGAIVVSRYAQAATPAEEAAAAGPGAPRWLLASVGAAVGFGVLIPAMRALGPVFGEVGPIGVVYAADTAARATARARLPGEPRAAPRPSLAPVLLAGLFETAGFACIALGARLAPLALLSPLASLAAALTILYAWVVLGERPARGVLIGAALVGGRRRAGALRARRSR